MIINFYINIYILHNYDIYIYIISNYTYALIVKCIRTYVYISQFYYSEIISHGYDCDLLKKNWTQKQWLAKEAVTCASRRKVALEEVNLERIAGAILREARPAFRSWSSSVESLALVVTLPVTPLPRLCYHCEIFLY